VVRKLFTILGIACVSFALISWGGTGHYKINYNASLSFNSEMTEFSSWVSYLAEHASDADSRKYSSDPYYDPNEAIKHYIDIDNYADFINSGLIEQNYTAAVAKYGQLTINSNGTLPWATETAYNNLKNSLAQHDWESAKQYAADLGHYVADGHMPLHITKNYDGALTGNYGIHSRYESTMINSYNSLITYTGSSVNVIANVNQYIFSYIYANNKYVDSVITADNYAKALAGGSTSSTIYNQALWTKTQGFTVKLFKNASNALAELMYTAWVQTQYTSDQQNPFGRFTEILEQNSPNPFATHTSIKFNLSENSEVVIQVKDVLGNNVTTLFSGLKPAGNYSIDWNPKNQHEGIYFVVLDTKKQHQVKKMLLVR